MEEWRNLASGEILQLQSQHCKADDWNQVKVSPHFSAKNIEDSSFSGDVFLGSFGKELLLSGGVRVESGIYHARIHNCRISDNVYINRINRYIANYHIGEGSIIENVDCIYTEGESRFGNGTVVAVLDETGSMPVTMYEGLSAHTAHVMVTNVHRPVLTEALSKIALDYARSVKSSMGQIGQACCIRNAGTIRNVKVGDGCEIEGASILDDGSLCSADSAFSGDQVEPVMAFAYVGAYVIARHFILAPGAVLKDGAQIERCFVGEAAELSHGFSAHDSLFFANCQMENGESCASFAGPYTVSMHKSTLLVGGMFSFCNLGSGTNQSNHFYKLGPMHHGVMERGCKTGSDTYLLWPGIIGAFTFIKGRHTDNPDTRCLPFSQLVEEEGKSWLSPGANLRSVGTLRDELKWPQRDKRASSQPQDKLCFDVLNPQTAEAINVGLEVLDSFMAAGQIAEYQYKGTFIRRSSVVKGRKLYQKALLVYMGAALNRKLERMDSDGIEKKDRLNTLLASSLHPVSQSWTDLSGLLVPDSELSVFLTDIEKGEIKSSSILEEGWARFFLSYDRWSWQSVLQLLARKNAKVVHMLELKDFIQLLEEWKEALEGFYEQMLIDGDLDLSMMQRYALGKRKMTHSFTDALRLSLEEIPAKAAHWKEFLS